MNRSDSDSAMPLYRRIPFQRSSKVRVLQFLNLPNREKKEKMGKKKRNSERSRETLKFKEKKNGNDFKKCVQLYVGWGKCLGGDMVYGSLY